MALRAVLLSALLVLAGCSALPGGPTHTATRDGKVVLSDGDLSFDAQPIYRRLLSMHGQSLRGAPRFALPVGNATEPGSDYFATSFARVWGIGGDAPNAIVGKHTYENEVFLDAAATTCARKRWVAHEVAEVIQARLEEGSMTRSRYTVDARQATTAIGDGAAAYAAERYLEQHTDCPTRDRSWREVRANLSTTGALIVGRYYFGQRYVEGRVDSLEAVESVFRVPALTTEQLIHGYGVDEERPRSLSVATSTGGGWTVNNSWGAIWFESRPQRMGELFVRVLLEGELAADRAAAAAAGWGNDRVVRFQRDGTAGYAWVLRWDGPDDADQFEAAMADYLDARGTASGGTWRVNGTTFDVRRLDDGTVVVLAGTDGFVEAAGASGSDGEVTVTVGG